MPPGVPIFVTEVQLGRAGPRNWDPVIRTKRPVRRPKLKPRKEGRNLIRLRDIHDDVYEKEARLERQVVN
jgi:hypothetical protein